MYKETVALKLKKARLEAGYTQQQIADFLNLNRENLSRYETGKLEPNIEILGSLCDFYEVSMDWIFGTKFQKK